jgi:hypothetical protein
MAITLQSKSVFYKMRDNHFFPPSVWAFAMSVTQVCWLLLADPTATTEAV